MLFNVGITRFAFALSLVGFAATAANASLTVVTSSIGGSAYAGASYVNFDNMALGGGGGTATGPNGSVGVSFATDGEVVTGAFSGKYAEPFLSGNNDLYFQNTLGSGDDTTKYITSGANPNTAAATINFTGGQKYLGILWGSVDGYNSLDFYSGVTLVGTIVGSQVKAFPNGDQGALGTRYVNISSSIPFDRIVARSNGQYAFEFDNVAYGANAIPEATTIAVWSGLSLLGWVAYRRRS